MHAAVYAASWQQLHAHVDCKRPPTHTNSAAPCVSSFCPLHIAAQASALLYLQCFLALYHSSLVVLRASDLGVLSVQLSASSAALDLALSPSPKPDSSRNWTNVNRHRAQQSLSSLNINGSSSQLGDLSAIGSRPTSMRHSLDLKYISESGDGSAGVISPKSNHVITTPPKLQSSFSANEVPTVKNSTGSSTMANNANNHAQQHFHNHNVNMGRIPAGAMPTRHSRELSSDSSMNAGRDQVGAFQSIHSALQASAAPFGPSMTTSAAPYSSATATSASTAPAMNGMNGMNGANGLNGVGGMNAMNGFPSYYSQNGYQNNGHNGVQFGGPMLAAGIQQLNLNGVSPGNMYPVQNFPGYNGVPFQHGSVAPQRDSQARVIQNRRQQLDPDGKLTDIYPIPRYDVLIMFQPCLATKTCPLNPSARRFTIFARISTAAAISKRNWRNETPSRFT